MFQFGYQSTVLNVPQIQVEIFFKNIFLKRNVGKIADSTAITLFSVATSLTLAGGVVGALGSGWIGNKFGRRNGLIYLQFLVLSAACLGGLCDVCDSFELLFISRFLAGIASGAFTGLVPLYVSEIAPVHLRGSAATCCNLAGCIGTFIALVLGLKQVLGRPDTWSYVLFAPALPAIVHLLFMPCMPESPRYLLKNKRDLEGAKRSLMLLRGGQNVDEEIQETIQEKEKNVIVDSALSHVEEDKLLEHHLSVLQFIQKSKYWLPLCVCIFMQLSSQGTGVVALIFYSTKFFQEAGISCSLSSWTSVGIGSILIIMTLVSVFLMERLGRRTLHVYIGLTGMLISCLVLNISIIGESHKENSNATSTNCIDPSPSSEATSNVSVYGILVLISSLSCVTLFAVGPGSIPWFITSEIFEEAPRAAATSVTMFFNWMFQITVALVFPQFQHHLGSYSFLPFLFLLFMTWLVLLLFLPETKNQSSSKMARLFEQPNAWCTPIGLQSVKFLKQLDDNFNETFHC